MSDDLEKDEIALVIPTEPEDHVFVPYEALQYLPDEWQQHFDRMREEGVALLSVVDDDLRNLNRLIQAFPSMASLRYIQKRLASTEFEATAEWAMENDMLTLAFVTTYFRLIDGGMGSGVSRKSLPSKLRKVHDQIIVLRHKRYAHNAGHDSLKSGMVIGFTEDQFSVSMNYKMGFHVGGALEWDPLVAFLDNLMVERLQKLLDRLSEKTGRKWGFSTGPAPHWVFDDPANPQ
ncbi:hypothetical protein MRBLMR1_001711 [Neorhizobium sp. LMR1-1-1.1]